METMTSPLDALNPVLRAMPRPLFFSIGNYSKLPVYLGEAVQNLTSVIDASVINRDDLVVSLEGSEGIPYPLQCGFGIFSLIVHWDDNR